MRLDFMLFTGLELYAPVPDETRHCRFRNALMKAGVFDALLSDISAQLEHHGLKVRHAEAAFIDASLIESAARLRRYIEAPAQDREEPELPADPDIRYSADDDARWVKKGRKSTLGYKGFARCDEEGFIDKVHVRPANAAESPEFETITEGSKAQRVLADKAYASAANRARLKGGHRDGIYA